MAQVDADTYLRLTTEQSPSRSDGLYLERSTNDMVVISNGSVVARFSSSGATGLTNIATTSAGDAAGDIIYRDAATTFERLAKGTAGQLLAINSGATAPSWVTAAGDIAGTTTPGTINLIDRFRKRSVASLATVGAGTYTAAALVGGTIVRDCVGASRTDTTDTAANIKAAVANAVVGAFVECVVVNDSDADETITLAGGAGVTLDITSGAGGTQGTLSDATIPQGQFMRLLFRLTNIGAGTEAADCYCIGRGGVRRSNLMVGSDAAGDMFYKSSANRLTRVGKGVAGQKLTMNAGSTAPVWDRNKILGCSFAGMSAADNPTNFESDYTAASGATGALNVCCLPSGLRFGYWILGAGQTITGPVGAVDAIDIACDQTDDEGLEVFSHWGPADGTPFSVGFDAGFYMLVKLAIQTINGCDDLFVGFRKVEAHNAAMESYNTYCGIGLNTAATPGAVKQRYELAGGGVTNKDTTETLASATDVQIKIMVDAAGACTIQTDLVAPGTLAAPTAVDAFSFADGDQIFPIVRFLHANAAQAGTIHVKEFFAGYL